MDRLPMTEILVRLPAKDIVRFRTVCKLWNEIIIDPYFINLHFDRSRSIKSNLHFLVKTNVLHLTDFDTFDNPAELNYPYKSPIFFGGVEILGSCRGLLLLWRFDHDLTLFVYNPTNRTHKKIPFLERPCGFSELNGKVNFGFGYDSVVDDYKCVRIFQQLCKTTGCFKSEVMVYSLKADSWKKGCDLPCYFRNKKSNNVLLKGRVHWIGEDGYKQLIPAVVAFSVRDETFHSIALPEWDPKPNSTGTQVSVLGERLCVIADYPNHSDLWFMRDYSVTGPWTLLFRFAKDAPAKYLERLICFSVSREKMFVKTSYRGVASVDIKTSTWMDVKVADSDRCLDAHVCVDNLLMLGGIPGDDVDADAGTDADVEAPKQKRKPSKKRTKRKKMN